MLKCASLQKSLFLESVVIDNHRVFSFMIESIKTKLFEQCGYIFYLTNVQKIWGSKSFVYRISKDKKLKFEINFKEFKKKRIANGLAENTCRELQSCHEDAFLHTGNNAMHPSNFITFHKNTHTHTPTSRGTTIYKKNGDEVHQNSLQETTIVIVNRRLQRELLKHWSPILTLLKLHSQM